MGQGTSTHKPLPPTFVGVGALARIFLTQFLDCIIITKVVDLLTKESRKYFTLYAVQQTSTGLVQTLFMPRFRSNNVKHLSLSH
ncbi:MAG: hypothetical protein AB1393_01620, partial [Candidatus Edwardsbacteria bacterium]